MQSMMQVSHDIFIMPAFPLAHDFVHDEIDAQNKLTDGSCTGC